MPLADIVNDPRFKAANPEDQAMVLKQAGASDAFVNRYIDSGIGPQSFGLNKATSISAPPAYQQPMGRIPAIPGLTGTPIDLPSAEGMAEVLPAAAATGATLAATRNPGMAATAGGMAGEAGRQLLRRLMGAPAATGVMQSAFDLDPNSAKASVAGFGGEALAGVAGAGASKALKALSGGSTRSAERSIVRNILGGVRNERELAEAPNLAKRAQAAGALRSLTKRGRMAHAQSALKDATGVTDVATQTARATGKGVEAWPALTAIRDELPPSIPGSGAARTAMASERNATTNLLNDELDVVVNTGDGASGHEIPLDVTLGEIKVLDDMLDTMYDRGALEPAHGKKAIQVGSAAFRTQLRTAFPELADARLKKHELLTITKMMQRGLDAEYKAGGGSDELASELGAAAVGRYGPGGAGVFRFLARTTAPLSIPGRQLVAKLAAGGAHTAQVWIRAADFMGLNESTDNQIGASERHRKAESALRSQAEGVVAP